MVNDRNVAGIRCGEVLAELSDFLDGDMEPARAAQVTAHLKECDACEQFGGTFSAAIRALKRFGTCPPDPGGRVFERLNDHLRKAMPPEGSS